MKRFSITGLFFLLSVLGFTQGEWNQWRFGSHISLDFNSGNPVQIGNNAMAAFNGTVSISDSVGNLLFYSDGRKVWDRSNNIMPNGDSIYGYWQPVNPAFVVKRLSNDSTYYLFTVGNGGGGNFKYGLHYSILDMRLNSGLGDIPAGMKNIPVNAADSAFNFLYGTRHKNNKDAWVLVKQHPLMSNTWPYMAFRVSSSGVDTVPVISPSNLGRNLLSSNEGVIKISQDGTKLVSTGQCQALGFISQVEFCNFNNQTGQVTPLFLFSPSTPSSVPSSPYWAEFSKNGHYLYVEASSAGFYQYNLFQYDATKTDYASLMASEVLLGTKCLSMQLASNNKIYVNTLPGPPPIDSMHVINYPDSGGLACNFQKNVLWLQGQYATNGSIPQFLQKYFAEINFQDRCLGDTIKFTSLVWPPADTINWNFGDPTSGSLNTSSLGNPSHLYALPGSYQIIFYVRHNDNRTDTVWKTVHIYPHPTPDLGIDRSICSGDSVTFDAGACPGCSYIWSNLTGGLPNIGNNQTYTAKTTGQYMVKVTNSFGCTGYDTVNLLVTPNLPVSVSVSPTANPVCAGTSVTFMATPTWGGTTPVYQWKVNGLIVGTNSPTYSYIPLNNDVITCKLTSSETCTTGNPAISNQVTMTVNPNLLVSISISPSANPFCIGGSVTFTATPTNGGTPPAYQWKVNGVNAGINSSTFTYNPVSGDLVTCVMNSSIACPTGNPAASNTITMIGNTGLPAGVSITANPNPFCPGTSVTFTATPNNGGSNPSYQWKVNGLNTGTNSSIFSYNPVTGDKVTCLMTSNLACVSGNPALSNEITLSGTLAPIVSFTTCFDTVTTVNAKPIKLKGGIPLNGTYTGPGVSANTFNPAVAGIGNKTITYTYTNAILCSASKTKTITVQATPAFTCGNNLTDIRDGKSYTTVQIGGQCWMAADLNYGIEIPSTQHQRDNCISEVYHNPAASSQKPVYHWDEIMRYDDSPGLQGLCPPAWHVPTEAEWNTLFSFYINNGFAGSPLKYSGFSGFNALLSGVNHFNRQWDFNGFATFFWSSTPYGPYKAWAHGMNDYNPSVSFYPSSRANAFSVRCIKDF